MCVICICPACKGIMVGRLDNQFYNLDLKLDTIIFFGSPKSIQHTCMFFLTCRNRRRRGIFMQKIIRRPKHNQTATCKFTNCRF